MVVVAGGAEVGAAVGEGDMDGGVLVSGKVIWKSQCNTCMHAVW